MSLALIVVCNGCGSEERVDRRGRRGMVAAVRHALAYRGWTNPDKGGDDFCPNCSRERAQ